MIKATIIIPSHKIEDDREGNLMSLLADLQRSVDLDEYKVVVVANSADVARQMGIGNAPAGRIDNTPMTCVNMYDNHGLTAAWNEGLKRREGKYTFFVNHDLIITKDENPFEKMIQAVEEYEDIGKYVFVFGVEGTRQTPNPEVKMIQRFENGQFTEVIEVDEVSGFLFGINNNYLHERFFDEALSPAFYEEMDLCQATRSMNTSLPLSTRIHNILIPGINYKHVFGVSTHHPFKAYIHWFNSEAREHRSETIAKITRRNKKYLEDKWNIQLG